MIYRKNMIDIRKENGHTQQELAKILGWSRPQIARYELGTSTPTIDYLEAFCKYYKISADWLLDLPKECKERKEKRKGK